MVDALFSQGIQFPVVLTCTIHSLSIIMDSRTCLKIMGGLEPFSGRAPTKPRAPRYDRGRLTNVVGRRPQVFAKLLDSLCSCEHRG